MSFFNQLLHVLSIILPIIAFTRDDCDKVRTSGTGTVLFNPTDVYKTCWSQEEIAILTARIFFEDIIPDQKRMSIQCNEDVQDVISYFKAVIETVRSKTKARKRHVLLLALTDLLGGFLHHAVLPMARKAYYAGAVDYELMEKLIQLYEELKWFLRTNGQGWSKPIILHKEVKVPIIDMTSSNPEKSEDNNTYCRKLMYYEHEPVKSRKRSVTVEKGVYFPLPFFDAKVKPTAIALPLKHFALRNIESRRAAYAVMKYFIMAEQCLKERGSKSDVVEKFRNNLYTWIEKDVIQKLDDDKFYSAFGGILRVENTLKVLGARVGNKPCSPDEIEEEVGAVPGIGCNSKRNKLFLIAMLVIIVAWFLIGTCFICYRMKNNRSNQKGDYVDDGGKSASSGSYSSSKWSSILSRSSSKTDKLCKCESTLTEKTTSEYTSTSEYDSGKTAKRRERSRNLKSLKASMKKTSQSSPCVCPKDGPAIIDAKHTIKVLPSIAEMSENSMQKENKKGSFRKITFADASSSSDGGVKRCAPPWAQTANTIPCPILSDKSTNYSSSKIVTPTQGVQDYSYSDAPVGSSSRTDDPSTGHVSQQMPSNESFQNHHPQANSTRKDEETHTSPLDNSSSRSMDKKTIENINTFLYEEPETKPEIKQEPQFKHENESYFDYHVGACHSSMTGSYDLYHRPEPGKPYIFGYDFQTTTSSEISEDDDNGPKY